MDLPVFPGDFACDFPGDPFAVPPGRPDTDDNHATLMQGLRWQVPERFNIAEACCGRWARRTPEAIALVIDREGADPERHRYADLQAAANRLSQRLVQLGVQRGDRIAIVLPQCAETAVAHVAVYQLGAVAMPLALLFGPEALAYRLHDGGVRLAIVAAAALPAIEAARASAPALAQLIVVSPPGEDVPPLQQGLACLAWSEALAGQTGGFKPVETAADEPAVLIYTSGTTGPPKGALIPHRALLGNLSGFVCSQNGFPHVEPHADDGLPDAPVFWSPADWAWTGGLMDVLLPTLYFGATVVGSPGRFSPQRAFELLQRHRVTHSFLFPTALKAMMKACPEPGSAYALRLRALMSAGEAVGDAVFAWCRDALGVPVNEMFGQTEINYVVGNCARALDVQGRPVAGWPARPGSMGRGYPGHRVAVIDDEGRECPRGTPGEVAVHRRDVHGEPDPVFFLGYWHNDAATQAKYTGAVDDSWCRTGDTAVMDADGYLWYQGRADDLFKAAGYRIGPSEVENCLVKHPAVANAAVVPKPDAERGAVVKAYVVLAPGWVGDAALVDALQAHVRERLAPYEYPKEIEFIDALPMTTTGKVLRRVLRLQEEERARAARGS
ncbi:AMP-binding protein [Sphaerotilus microaerophilus]|uniref:AMP-binding protein n=2 Tax=Sphaerotilus microaerophilus TaxID=2914710 RepID=A0ABM7YLL2_9BURK|nr:AMP-binding protein [Sphaerotilus sp. FB-5]